MLTMKVAIAIQKKKNPKLRAIQSARRERKNKGKKKERRNEKIIIEKTTKGVQRLNLSNSTQNHSLRISILLKKLIMIQ